MRYLLATAVTMTAGFVGGVAGWWTGVAMNRKRAASSDKPCVRLDTDDVEAQTVPSASGGGVSRIRPTLVEVTPVRSAICLGMVPFLCGWIGCRQATPVVPGTETYSVEAKQSELVAGEARKVDILVRYHRTNQPAAQLKYTVQLRAPRALTVTPSRWDMQQNLTTGDAGLNYSGLAIIEVAEDASPGEVEVAATITPAKGTPTTAPLRFRVVGKGG